MKRVIFTILLWQGLGLASNFDSEEISSMAAKKLSTISSDGQDLTIPQGMSVEIDTNRTFRKLTIKGKLYCPLNGNFILRATGISIAGKGASFICGTSKKPFAGTLKIGLLPGTPQSFMVGVASDRSFVVGAGATLRLTAATAKASWVHLNKTASVGEQQLQLDSPVNWSAGDEIVIAPTGFRFDEADFSRVASVSEDGTMIRLESPLRFSHWGDLQKFQGSKEWIVDERAEIANLSRSIVIASEGDPSTMDYRGAHLMVMAGGAAYVDGVEFVHMGRMGEMGRYPFHWHRAGNVQGQFIKNSSIHHSFQRCIVVHGTQNAVVKNNVCFDHFGHGFFLEDGDETGNSIVNNLGILSRRPPRGRQLLASDINTDSVDRFPGPSTFWISNPQNIVRGNVAAGSEGTGIWNSFSGPRYCESAFCQMPDAQHPANMTPVKMATQEFSNNIAHSCGVGITWDGVPDGGLTGNSNNPKDRYLTTSHYSPPQAPQFKNLSYFKNRFAGVYFRGTTAYFSNSVLADNAVGLFFAYNQVVTNSAVIAMSANHTDADAQWTTEYTGIRIYDGPFDLRAIDFINFPTEPLSYNGQEFIPTPFALIGAANRFVNVVQKLHFFPEPYRRIEMTSARVYPWADWNTSPAVRDLDGSLTGTPNRVVVPDHPINEDKSCERLDRGSALSCSQQRGEIVLLSIRDNQAWENIPFRVRRNDNIWSYPDYKVFKDLPYHLKFGLILGKQFEYEVHFKPDWVMPGKNSNGAWFPNSFQIIFQAENAGLVSPVIAFNGLGQNCRMFSNARYNPWVNATSLDNLRQQTVNSFFSSGPVLYAKFVATEAPETTPAPSEFIKMARNKMAMVQCN